MSERRRILAFSFFPAFVPPQNGGVERLYQLYSSLSKYHDVTIISSSFLDGEREVVSHTPCFTEIRVPKDTHFATSYNDLANGSEGSADVSGPALGHSAQFFSGLHDEYLDQYSQAEIIIHDSPFLIRCDLFRGFDSKFRIYNSYNCETDLYSSLHAGSADRSRISQLVNELEGDVCRSSQLITVCSGEDADALKERFAPSAPFMLLPNGYVPNSRFTESPREPRSLLFMGSGHKPNIDAAELIVNEIAPKMQDVDFHLIGSCYPKGQRENVIAHGVVAPQEKQLLLRQATAALNPMASGGGSSLKVADIASNSLPLISTSLGARGFGLEAGIHYIRIDNENVVETIQSTLSDGSKLRTVAEAARFHFEANYQWDEIARRFAANLDTLMCTSKAKPTATLVINDYDSFEAIGGGATRTRGLCRGMAKTGPIIFIAFTNEGPARRRVSEDGSILSLLVDKLPDHSNDHVEHAALHWVSSADVINYVRAPQNPKLLAVFECAASCSSTIICEHPYMVGLPRAFGLDFVYSSQNFEAGLKTEGLRHHPLSDQLVSLVRSAESYACEASDLIITVSESDASSLSGTYRSTAPIMVIPNGADGPALGDFAISDEASGQGRPVGIFMGSVHGPNLEAARWIATDLAPRLPQYDFLILGSIAESLERPFPSNLKLIGEVSAQEKTKHLYAAQIALNPMMSGSGSNVKIADYLQHGLPVLTTEFGARGYGRMSASDVVVAPLENFCSIFSELLSSGASTVEVRRARETIYASALSMDAGGQELARLVKEHSGTRKRALYVTYRYHDPALGGGEEYVDRLVHSLARSGWRVDVLSPAADRIQDVGRFAANFSGAVFQPTPIGRIRVRSMKFPLDTKPSAAGALQEVWRFQSEFEEQVARALSPPRDASLAWGWADPQADGRWSLTTAGLNMPAGGSIRLQGRAISHLWLQLFDNEGGRIASVEVEDEVNAVWEAPPGFVSMRASLRQGFPHDDPRPLALFVTLLELNGISVLRDRIADRWMETNNSLDRMTAMASARAVARDRHLLNLSPLRGSSDELDEYVREHAGHYDLLITHNAIFRQTSVAIRAAKLAQMPSILIPHLHYDDDFYHFEDVLATCAAATKTLVCPSATNELLHAEGLDNTSLFTPGVDLIEAATPDDIVTFKSALSRPVNGFFLVLGRKAQAKSYREVIAAVDRIDKNLNISIVMIGPDDDGTLIDHPNVQYLGRRPESVVRGAMHECLGLVNMSRSESFGMVILQAGLAGRPVIVNRNCAAFADLVEDGVNGFLSSFEDLPENMERLSSDPLLCEELGRRGRDMALKYDWNEVEKKFILICNSLVH